MREVKFRVWYGSPRRIFSKVFTLADLMNGDAFEVLNDAPLMRDYKMLDTMEQFTGLQDKNGVDIFEGDIIPTIENNHSINNVVKWDANNAKFVFGGWDFSWGPVDGTKTIVEIVGNIHQHPELKEE